MEGPTWSAERPAWTRAGLLRAAAGAALVAGGSAIVADRRGGTSVAAPSPDRDAEILNALLQLEYVQQAFYREALRRSRLGGELRAFASTVGGQEDEHVAFLARRLGSGAAPRPSSDFGDALSTPERFRDAAIRLEEATIAALIGQGANLTAGTLRAVAPLLSVEARQVAWARDLAGVSPAPRAADPARSLDDVLAELRGESYLR